MCLPVQRCAENNSVNSAKRCVKKNEGTEMFPRSFGKRVFFVYVYGYVVTNPFFQFVGTDT